MITIRVPDVDGGDSRLIMPAQTASGFITDEMHPIFVLADILGNNKEVIHKASLITGSMLYKYAKEICKDFISIEVSERRGNKTCELKMYNLENVTHQQFLPSYACKSLIFSQYVFFSEEYVMRSWVDLNIEHGRG
jgi:hypothetical protein